MCTFLCNKWKLESDWRVLERVLSLYVRCSQRAKPPKGETVTLGERCDNFDGYCRYCHVHMSERSSIAAALSSDLCTLYVWIRIIDAELFASYENVLYPSSLTRNFPMQVILWLFIVDHRNHITMCTRSTLHSQPHFKRFYFTIESLYYVYNRTTECQNKCGARREQSNGLTSVLSAATKNITLN